MLRIILVSAGQGISPELWDTLGTYVQRKLTEENVAIRSNCKVITVKDHEVTLSDGTTVPASTLGWTAGISPLALVDTLPCPKAKGQASSTSIWKFLSGLGSWPWAAVHSCRIPRRESSTLSPGNTRWVKDKWLDGLSVPPFEATG